MKVLVVDDDQSNLDLVVHHLRNEGFDITTSRRGDEAFEITKKERPDLAIIDGLIPGIHGFELCKKIKEELGPEGCPKIIIMSSVYQGLKYKHEVMKTWKADDYLTKPVDKSNLLLIINRLLNRETAAEQAHAEGKERIVVQVDPDLEKLVPRYLENRRKDILSIENALKAGEYETIRILGHSMKGSGGGYGFALIADLGALLEQAATTSNPAEITEVLARLSDYLQRVEVVYG